MASKREDVLAKIQKLLKLSEGSSNIHEAQSAAARAQKMMLEYNIEQCIAPVEMVEKEEEIKDFRDEPFETTGRFENWRFVLLGIVCRLNNCEGVKRRAKYQETMVYMVGRPADVQTSKYIYQYLSREIEQLSQRQRGMGKKFIASYKSGCVLGVRENLEAERDKIMTEKYATAAQEGVVALMRMDDVRSALIRKENELQLFIRHSTNIKSSKMNWRINSETGLEMGRRDGKNIRTQVSGPALGSPAKQVE